MPTPERLAEEFEKHRAYLRAVAYRMLGSASEAEDAVQESWIRLARIDASAVENLRGWLTTVVARVCLDMLRTRTSRREDSLETHVPDPVISSATRILSPTRCSPIRLGLRFSWCWKPSSPRSGSPSSCTT